MTTQTTHTPGPWDIFPSPEAITIGRHEPHSNLVRSVAQCLPEDIANARLIAALPDLLDALDTIASGNTDPDRMVEIAAEALRKAEGRAE